MDRTRIGKLITAACFVMGTWMLASGCEQKEKIIEIETPGAEVEVERDKKTGEVDVKVRGEQPDD